jgi:hypothetical protein
MFKNCCRKYSVYIIGDKHIWSAAWFICVGSLFRLKISEHYHYHTEEQQTTGKTATAVTASQLNA